MTSSVSLRPAGSRWLFLLALIVLMAVVCLGLFLLGPGMAKNKQGWVLPVSLHSLLRSNYNADPLAQQVPVFDMSVVEELLRDQGSGNNLPGRMATLVKDLLTPVGTAAPSATPDGPTPARGDLPSLTLTHAPLPGGGIVSFSATPTLTPALMLSSTPTPLYPLTGTPTPTNAIFPSLTITYPATPSPTFTNILPSATPVRPPTLTLTLPGRTSTSTLTPIPPTALPSFTATAVFTSTRARTATQPPATPLPTAVTPPYPPPPGDTPTRSIYP